MAAARLLAASDAASGDSPSSRECRTMTAEAPPFRADHVGSLLRPQPLLAARAEYEGGWITAETLRGCEDDCIKKAVAMQAELGLKGVTDGEFRRGSWHRDFLYPIGGGARTRPTPPTKLN